MQLFIKPLTPRSYKQLSRLVGVWITIFLMDSSIHSLKDLNNCEEVLLQRWLVNFVKM